jgi:hypothetical protein
VRSDLQERIETGSIVKVDPKRYRPRVSPRTTPASLRLAAMGKSGPAATYFFTCDRWVTALIFDCKFGLLDI